MKNKNWTPKFIALAVACLLVGIGMGLLGYHYFRDGMVWVIVAIAATYGLVFALVKARKAKIKHKETP